MPTVVDIVPNGVEATGKGGDGRHEGVGQPDGEDSVFLSHALGGADGLGVMAADFATEEELEDAGGSRGHGDGHHVTYGAVGVHDGFYGGGYGEGKGDGPEVEGEVAYAGAPLSDGGIDSSEYHGQQEGTEEQWEYLV